LAEECEELFTKYPEMYEKHKVSLLAVKLIGAFIIKPKLNEWEVKRDPLFLYHHYYEIREILTIGKSTTFIKEDDGDDDVESSWFGKLKKNKAIDIERASEEEYKNSDVLYWLYETYWL
jgi:hypothetical protein